MKLGRTWAAAAAFFLLVVACAPPPRTVATITSPTPTPLPSPTPTTPLTPVVAPGFHSGEVDLPYEPIAISSTGGRAPYTYSLTSGALPTGLSMNSGGGIGGTPTTPGTFLFTIQVADSGDSKTSVDGKISIAPHVAASLLPACAQYCNVELGCADACGLFGTLGGGVGPYTYALTQGTLPAGTALSTLSLTGTFSGQPGWLQFTVQVTDALGATSAISPKFWMYPHISLANAGCGNANSPRSCTVAVPYSGGTPGQALTLASTSWVGAQRCGFGAVPVYCEQPTVAATFQPGQVILTLTYGPNSTFTYGTLGVRLTGGDRCAPNTACTADAAITVNG